jgi:hypothetical protein
LKKFIDASGREWSIVVNVGTAKLVRDLTQVDLFNLFSSEAQRVFSDPILLVNVLYVLVSSQCKERAVTEESFGESLYGDAIENASTAMLEEVANFFPSGRRQIALKTLQKTTAAQKEMEAKAMTAIEALDLSQISLNPATKPLVS